MSSKHPPDPKEAGFTIIESLVAILVVSALLTAIAPVIGISAANRVQAKRIEQAANASRAYLDSLRTGESPTPPITNKRFASEANTSEIQNSDARVIQVNGNNSCVKGNDDYKTPYFLCERAATYELICADGDGQLNATAGFTTYEWSNNEGSASITVEFLATHGRIFSKLSKVP